MPRGLRLLIVMAIAGCSKTEPPEPPPLAPPGPPVVEEVAAHQTNPASLIIRGDTVFWMNSNLDAPDPAYGIYVRQPGSAPRQLSPEAGAIAHMVADDRDLYVALERTGTITRIPQHGGKAAVVVTDQNGLYGLAMDDANLYWIAKQPDKTQSVWRQPKAGGARVERLRGIADLAMDIAIDGDDLYTRSESAISRCAKGGTEPATLLVHDSTRIDLWAVADGRVYWVSRTPDGKVWEIWTLVDGKPKTLLHTDVRPGDIAVADKQLYWSAGDPAPRTLNTMSISGGPSVVLYRPGPGYVISLSPKRLYWTENDGAIRSIPRR